MRALKDMQLMVLIWTAVCVSQTYCAVDGCNDGSRGVCPPEDMEPEPKGDEGTDPLPGTGDLGRELDKTDSKETDPAPEPHFKCHGQRFDPKTQTCCDGKINDVSSLHNPNIKCCGVVAFDNSLKVCCNLGRPQRINKRREFAGCCGNRPIDTEHRVCCSGKPFLKKDANRCCEADGYDKSRSICCERRGRLINAPGNRCCGGTPFFNTNERKLCCDNHMQTRSGKGPRRCCGKMIYNPEIGQCHIGRVTRKKAKKGGTGKVQPHDPNVIPEGVDRYQYCCGNLQFTVFKNTLLRCCGDQPFFIPSSQCCGSEVVDVD